MLIHVCLVSDQVLANLIPALMEKPERLVLVASAEMVARDIPSRLANELAKHGLPYDIVADAPSTGLAGIARYARALSDSIGETYPNAQITLNVTGGTKLMTLGFVDAFQHSRSRIIYTDTAHRCIEVVSNPADAVQPMHNVIDVPAYLAAQGMRFSSADSDLKAKQREIAARRDLTLFMGEQVGRLQSAIKTLNGILSSSIKRDPATRDDVLAQPDFTMRGKPHGAFKELLERCVSNGLMNWDASTLQGKFTNIASAKYLHGGWLEEYAWIKASTLQPFDVRMGTHITSARPEEDEINEFDLLLTHGNELLFIECKTANYQKQEGQANAATYKIDSLGRQARGLFGQTWLLSAINPPANLLDRARDLRILVLGPDEISRLGELLTEWIDGQ